MKILKTGNCPSLSGASTLTYEIGYDSEIRFRITGNTGGGLFGKEWVAWSAIEPALVEPITAGALKRAGVCKGKSANTPGFLLAVLKAEALVKDQAKADPKAFLAAMEKLIAPGRKKAS